MQTSKLGKYQINYHNVGEFRELKQEIWTQGQYYWDFDDEDGDIEDEDATHSPTPIILDLGAHIGVTSLYFATIYANARIYAVEPNPVNCALFRSNIEINQLEDQITLYEVALAAHEGRQMLYYDDTVAIEENWSISAGLIPRAWNNQQLKQQEVSVPMIKMSTLLDEIMEDLEEKGLLRDNPPQIDLVKMDIEGMEGEVIMEIRPYLRHIKRFLIEYHPSGKQKLLPLVKMLEDAGMVVELALADDHKVWPARTDEPEELLLIRAWRRVKKAKK